jgi:hypothetical protein
MNSILPLKTIKNNKIFTIIPDIVDKLTRKIIFLLKIIFILICANIYIEEADNSEEIEWADKTENPDLNYPQCMHYIFISIVDMFEIQEKDNSNNEIEISPNTRNTEVNNEVDYEEFDL